MGDVVSMRLENLIDELSLYQAGISGLDTKSIQLAVIERYLKVICRISAEKLPAAITLANLYWLLLHDKGMSLKRAIEIVKCMRIFLSIN